MLAHGEWKFWKRSDGTLCTESDTIQPEGSMNPLEMANWMNEAIGEGQRFSWAYYYDYEATHGHILTIYKENRKLRMYDPQTNKAFSGEEFLVMLKEYGTKKNRLFRMDDKLPIEEYASGIMKECSK